MTRPPSNLLLPACSSRRPKPHQEATALSTADLRHAIHLQAPGRIRTQDATREIRGGDSGESCNNVLMCPEMHSKIEDDGRYADLRDP